jgi:hypothetical protein
LWDEGKASGLARTFDIERTIARARERLEKARRNKSAAE